MSLRQQRRNETRSGEKFYWARGGKFWRKLFWDKEWEILKQFSIFTRGGKLEENFLLSKEWEILKKNIEQRVKNVKNFLKGWRKTLSRLREFLSQFL